MLWTSLFTPHSLETLVSPPTHSHAHTHTHTHIGSRSIGSRKSISQHGTFPFKKSSTVLAVATLQASVTSMATLADAKQCSRNFNEPVNTLKRDTPIHVHVEKHDQHCMSQRCVNLHLPNTHTQRGRVTMKNHHQQQQQHSGVIKDHLCCLLLLRYNKSCSPPDSSSLPLLLT